MADDRKRVCCVIHHNSRMVETAGGIIEILRQLNVVKDARCVDDGDIWRND